VQRPNVVSGVPFYLRRPDAAGRKVINSAAFTTPVPASAQGNLGRNALRGFSATQWDLTLRRQFRFYEHLSLQVGDDFFNILNHPNFGGPGKLFDLAAVRQSHTNAEQLPRRRGTERQTHAAVPDRWPALHTVGAQDAFFFSKSQSVGMDAQR
jgi:hypothetical protein